MRGFLIFLGVLFAAFSQECPMSSPYTGDPNNDPQSITRPSDGDGPGIKAGDVNPAIEGLADQIAARRLKADVFTANGTWTCPEGVTHVLLAGYGGGGGGGGGAGADTTANRRSTGGGGGGSAQGSMVAVPVTPGTVYNVVIGAGANNVGSLGAGGTGGGDGVQGGHGLPTTFGGTLARFDGARGGSGGKALVDTVGGNEGIAFGGDGVRDLWSSTPNRSFEAPAGHLAALLISRNGAASRGGDASVGIAVPTGWLYEFLHQGGRNHTLGQNINPGLGGALGADDGTNLGGGGGGGGAAGHQTGSAAGGNGGDGSAGAGANGSDGADAAANTGAGGGGGGGGGSGAASGGDGGQGGLGGSGKLWVIYQGKQAVTT